MNNLTVKNVNLFGDDIMAAKDKDGNIWAGAKWFCNGLGLSRGQANNELNKIQNDIVLKRGCTKFNAGVFDPNNEAVALKLDFVPLWLAKITITPSMRENNPELVEKLIEYQLKAKDVLAEAFLPQQTTVTYQYPLPAATFEAAANLGRLIERVMKAENSCPHEIAVVLRTVIQQSGIEIPDIFVKVPAYDQLSLNFSDEIVTR